MTALIIVVTIIVIIAIAPEPKGYDDDLLGM